MMYVDKRSESELVVVVVVVGMYFFSTWFEYILRELFGLYTIFKPLCGCNEMLRLETWTNIHMYRLYYVCMHLLCAPMYARAIYIKHTYTIFVIYTCSDWYLSRITRASSPPWRKNPDESGKIMIFGHKMLNCVNIISPQKNVCLFVTLQVSSENILNILVCVCVCVCIYLCVCGCFCVWCTYIYLIHICMILYSVFVAWAHIRKN